MLSKENKELIKQGFTLLSFLENKKGEYVLRQSNNGTTWSNRLTFLDSRIMLNVVEHLEKRNFRFVNLK